jgi:hypothetical protein
VKEEIVKFAISILTGSFQSVWKFALFRAAGDQLNE